MLGLGSCTQSFPCKYTRIMKKLWFFLLVDLFSFLRAQFWTSKTDCSSALCRCLLLAFVDRLSDRCRLQASYCAIPHILNLQCPLCSIQSPPPLPHFLYPLVTCQILNLISLPPPPPSVLLLLFKYQTLIQTQTH